MTQPGQNAPVQDASAQNTFVRVERDGGVARVVLDRPQVHNAFDDGLIAELTRAYAVAAQDPVIRVIVLRAEGAAFSAGAESG